MISEKNLFTNRVVSLLNSLPDGIVDYNTINCFKSRLDEFWINQVVDKEFIPVYITSSKKHPRNVIDG